MLKITVDPAGRQLVLEGSLTGPWVDTLDESWRQATKTNAPGDVAVDLSDVTFVDPRGKQLLGAIYQQGGRLSATGMNVAIIQEIANAASPHPSRAPRSRAFFWFALAVAATALFAQACAKDSAQEAANPADAPNNRPPVAVDVAEISAGTLTRSVDVVGSLAPKVTAEIKSEVTGTVTAVYVTEWVPVRAGTRLARLNTSENEATIDALKAAEAQARVAETRARREHDRAVQLKEYGLITSQSFDDARTALEAAEAAAAGARAQVRAADARLNKSFITSPIDGVVAYRGVNVGDRVENMGGNAPMFRIVNNRLLDLTVSVPSAELAAVRIGQTVEFSVDALPGRAFTGTVKFINPVVDEASRAAKLIAEVPNPDDTLKGGLFVKGRIVVSRQDDVLQVPRSALLNWDMTAARANVFVVRDGRVQAREVKTGRADGGVVAIESGLQRGERVVTRGAFALKPGDRVLVSGEGV